MHLDEDFDIMLLSARSEWCWGKIMDDYHTMIYKHNSNMNCGAESGIFYNELEISIAHKYKYKQVALLSLNSYTTTSIVALKSCQV